MRSLQLINVSGELYEVRNRFPYTKFKVQLEGDNSEILKSYFNVDKILRHHPTQEYFFVNLIEDAKVESYQSN
jgi:hypothetical protein